MNPLAISIRGPVAKSSRCSASSMRNKELPSSLVTHDQDVARNAHRTIVLRDGQVIADTTDFSQALQSLHSHDSVPSAC